jgi:predicted transcriptional regulator
MSLHPEYAQRIMSGVKQVEFRRRPLGRQVTHIVIYATAPVRAVIGVAEIQRSERASPAQLWAQFSTVGGIGREQFFAYFAGAHEGFAYVLGQTQACESPLHLGKAGLPSKPPQAFQYLANRTLQAVLRLSMPAGGAVTAA